MSNLFSDAVRNGQTQKTSKPKAKSTAKTFANTVRNTPVTTLTTNGMGAFVSTCRDNVDLFGKIGASRGKDIRPLFNQALIEDSELAIRIALWGRDVRSGAGERKLVRDILQHLESVNPDYLTKTQLLVKVAELGRWDDLLVFKTEEVRNAAFSVINIALAAGNGLCAKWMPRKGPIAVQLRSFLGLTPKQYRKTLVGLTNVVETQMCNREFGSINFNHVPSLAMSRYTKAFAKNAPEQFAAWKSALKKGDPKVAKVNAGAVYPYDIVKTVAYGDSAVADAQWDALPNYIGDANVLPIVDVSGSMTTTIGGRGKGVNISCLDVAVSLGMYCASKNTGKFKDIWMTFSSKPEFVTLRGTLSQRYNSMRTGAWQMSTNLEASLKLVLDTAVRGKVPANEMPKALLIMSDMQFNQCVTTSTNDSWGSRGSKPTARAIEMINEQYRQAGYTPPVVVFWNINAHDNAPVSFDETGTALVSGFSPSIMKSVLSANFENMSPEGIMRKTVMTDRYAFR